MKKIFNYLNKLILSIVLIPFVAIHDVYSQAAEVLEATKQREVKSLLWKISGKGIKTSYLFGTMHIICEDQYLWNENMQNALANSQNLVLEMDMSDAKLQMEAAKSMMLPPGDNLSNYFKFDEYEKFKQFASIHLKMYPIMVLEKLKPSAIMTLMSTAGITCAETKSYEMEMMKYAKQNNIPVKGLESLEDQMNALNASEDSKIVEYIMEMVNTNGDKGKKEMTMMMEKYVNQDVYGLERMISEYDSEALNSTVLLKNRNENWIVKLKEWMPNHSMFIAVGAAHLGGDYGVIELLRKEGFTVEAIQ